MNALQEVYYGVLHAGDFLTDEEQDVLRWGGNAKVTVPPRFSKSGSHAVTYKHATALECLVRTLSRVSLDFFPTSQSMHSLLHITVLSQRWLDHNR